MENINEENSEEMRMLGDEIEQLQSEVAALKVQLQDKQKNIMYQLSGQMQEAMCVSLINFSIHFQTSITLIQCSSCPIFSCKTPFLYKCMLSSSTGCLCVEGDKKEGRQQCCPG